MAGEVERLQELVDKYDNIVFFGGAGVSTESGIPDFRSQDGLYHQKYDYPPETILSHTFFMRKPEEFFKFYRDKMLCDTAKPNAAHLKLAELEQAGKLKAVITQNIDNLHQMAGSKKVLELHGSVYRNYCMKCHRFYDFAHMKASTGVPRCECGGIIKPDVVLYEEGLDNQTINEAVKAISEAQVLIIGELPGCLPGSRTDRLLPGRAPCSDQQIPDSERQICRPSDPGADRTGVCTDSLLKPVKGNCSGYCQSYIRGVRDYGTSL